MTEKPPEDSTWVVQPPEPRQLQIYIAVGDGVELDEEQRAALEALVRAFEERDVEGFAFGADCPTVSTSCTIRPCANLCSPYTVTCTTLQLPKFGML